MYDITAEVKSMLSKKEFETIVQKLLFKKRNIYSFEKKDQIVHFADTKDCKLYHKTPLTVRYRRNTQLLETTIKIHGRTMEQIKKLMKQYNDYKHHELKCEVDAVPHGTPSISFTMKHFQPNVFQAFSFTHMPKDFLSDVQREVFREHTTISLKDLRFTAPIQSKAFKFRTGYKEFESISLEERKIPHLFGEKVFEISAKTTAFTKHTGDHFDALLKKMNVHVFEKGKFKKERFYEAFFGIS